ncbi:hypothetical protein [Thermomonospora umbrina]|uniref:Uncharacterized protein n=1 Tax=Thermomonospora umbrina TaxID=111806 RepID=A0A3D9T0L4_9ACTN|nr:hypothetical protein [Thermomonospora umbrina]REF00341.1 hypothetical protein DFJ69_5873 [Thermomonospora umbrina]
MSDYLAELKDSGRRLAAAFTPPDMWSQPAASLAERWSYATRGEWTGDGALRKAGQVYCLAVALPAAGLCRLIDWVTERPARLLATVVLLVLLHRLPPLSWLI